MVMAAGVAGCSAPDIPVTPQPVRTVALPGSFKTYEGWTDDIRFLTSESIPPEGYVLTVRKRGVSVSYSDEHGKRYALTTLRQIEKDGVVPCCRITDRPQFSFRGFMLDPGRHFISVAETKKFLDAMAEYKLNYFHWHLTEDQGWRIQIDSYPLLTEIGAWRDRTMTGHLDDGMTDDMISYDNDPHGGFYTKDEIREIVAYADSLGIEIIPEIDMPGHIQSALAAYPDLGCTGGPYKVWERWGITPEVMCPGKEFTFDFVEGVIAELVELFPGRYVHIGGDEVPTVRWKECPHCQARIDSLGLRGRDEEPENYLMNWFIDRVAAIIEKYGKTPMMYEEAVMRGDFPQSDVVIMDAVQGPEKGYTSIMSDYEFTYFDYCQGPHNSEPLSIGGYIPPRKLYAYNPYHGIKPEYRKNIIGTLCYLWSEYIDNDDYLEYMCFPRMQVLSELCWCDPQFKDWKRFQKKLIEHDYPIMDRMGINYARSAEDLPRNHLELIPYPKSVDIRGGVLHYNESLVKYTEDPSLQEQAYRLTIGPDSIRVCYGSPAGLHYALTTLKQLLPLDGSADLPLCAIEDAPRLEIRALLLDCQRKTSVREIEKILEAMAMYKYNLFKWDTHGFYSAREQARVERSAQKLGIAVLHCSVGTEPKWPDAVPFSIGQGAYERDDPHSVYLSATYTYYIKAKDMSAYVQLSKMPDDKTLEYMLFPRLGIFAENLWGYEENKDFGRVMETVWDTEFERYRRLGLNFRDY